jgi:hypothetical protein
VTVEGKLVLGGVTDSDFLQEAKAIEIAIIVVNILALFIFVCFIRGPTI